MAIVFSCPRCDRKYSVSDAMAGRRVTCKACGQERTVPTSAPPSAPPPMNAYSMPAPAQKPRPAPTPTYDDFDELPPEPEPRPYTSVDEEFDDQYNNGFQPAPRPKISRPAAPRPKRQAVHSPASDMNVGGIVGGYLGINVIAFMIAIALGAGGVMDPFEAGKYVGILFAATSIGMIALGLIAMIMVGFAESTEQGMLCLLLPYQVIYLFTRWEEAKKPFAILLTGALAIGLPYLYFHGMPAFGGGSANGNTAKSRQVEAIMHEYAATLEDMAGQLAEVKDQESARQVGPRLEGTAAKMRDVLERLKGLGNITKAEETYIKAQLGTEMRAVLAKLKVQIQRMQAFPDTFGLFANLKGSIDRDLTFWGVPAGDNANQPFVVDGNPPAGGGGGGGGAAPNPNPGFAAKPAEPPIPEGTDPITKSLLQIQSTDRGRRREGLDRLPRLKPNDKLDEVAKALIAMLEDDDIFLVANVIEALVVWKTPDVVPALCEKLADNRGFVRHKTIEALGKMKDPRAIGPLLDRLKEDMFQVRDALKPFGASAEGPLIAKLKDDDPTVRRHACDILKEVGGKETLKAMDELPPDADGLTRMAAQGAYEDIVRRVGPLPAAERPKGKVPAGVKGRNRF